MPGDGTSERAGQTANGGCHVPVVSPVGRRLPAQDEQRQTGKRQVEPKKDITMLPVEVLENVLHICGQRRESVAAGQARPVWSNSGISPSTALAGLVSNPVIRAHM